MTKEEVSLSEKECMFDNAEHIVKAFPTADVREAVRRLKVECKIDWDKGNFVLANVNERIDKIFGEKLI